MSKESATANELVLDQPRPVESKHPATWDFAVYLRNEIYERHGV